MKKKLALCLAVILACTVPIVCKTDRVGADTKDGRNASSTTPDYYFPMDGVSSNVVAVSREGDKDDFTARTTEYSTGVMPTKEYADTIGAQLRYEDGVTGKALYLDRSKSYGAQLKNIDLGSGSWSVSFWVKADSPISQFMPIFFTCSENAVTDPDTLKWLSVMRSGEGWLNNGSACPCILSRNAERNEFPWYGYQNAEGTWLGDEEDERATAISEGEWVYITLVIDTSDTCEYGDVADEWYVKGPHAWTYVNGELFGQGTVANELMSSSNKFFLGINLWDCPVKACYDDVALWKKALTRAQVKAIYEAEADGKTPSEAVVAGVDSGSGQNNTPASTSTPVPASTGIPSGNPDAPTTETPQVKQTESPTAAATPTSAPTAGNGTASLQTTTSGNSGSNAENASSSQTKKKTIKLSSVKVKRGTRKITGKVSVSKAVVKVKAGNKAYKKATVKGKTFTLKTSRLKKGTRVLIKVSKKGYKTLTKTYKVK